MADVVAFVCVPTLLRCVDEVGKFSDCESIMHGTSMVPPERKTWRTHVSRLKLLALLNLGFCLFAVASS